MRKLKLVSRELSAGSIRLDRPELTHRVDETWRSKYCHLEDYRMIVDAIKSLLSQAPFGVWRS